MRDDAALVQSLRSGDTDALGDLFQKYADRIYRLACGLMGSADSAEDVVQDTFLKALKHLDRFEGRSNLGTWLYRVSYNTCMDKLRKRSHQPLPPDETDDLDGDLPWPKLMTPWRYSPEEILHNAETRKILDEAIQELPEGMRAVFLLRDIEHLSTAETAEAIGISGDAVKVRLHRARLNLRERLAAHFALPKRIERGGGR